MFRLLLVEDEYIEREAMKHIIGQRFNEKFEIKEATNGLDAIELARTFKPDIIFLDIKMPGCSGIEVARSIREFLPEANMIFITAYDYFDYAKEAISLRVDEFLLKPVDVDEVCRYVEKIVRKLKEEQLQHTYTEKIQHEFSVIKEKFQSEFKERILDYQASEEQIQHYLELMDIKMECAVIGLIDFTTIEQYEGMGHIQKEFIKERFKGKLEKKCELSHIIAMVGDLKDLVTVVFLLQAHHRYKAQDMCRILEEEMDGCIQSIGMSISYQLSETIINPGEIPKVLYQEKQRFFASNKKEKKTYPYEIEDKIVELIRKKEFEEAKRQVIKIIEYLKSEYEFVEFKKELQGLYTIVERSIRRNAPELLLQGSDRLASDVGSYSDLMSFYNHMFDYAKEMMKQMPDKNEALIQKVCSYLEEHYNEDISLEEAASMIGFSSFYFTKLMKEHTNMSYVDYITSLRVNQAKKLLETTDMTVKDVGIAVGYENANYFTRVFKRMEGSSPSQYKSKLK